MTKKLKITITLIIAFICCTTIISSIYLYYNHLRNSMDINIQGDSMYPTFKDGDTVRINLNFNYNDISRNDIVVFRKTDSDELFIKRVVGLVGDKIEIKENNLYVNGEQYINVDDTNVENYIYNSSWNVGINELYVIGDNYTNSIDSRYYGCIDKENILGVIKE